jgi:hypothetical protein
VVELGSRPIFQGDSEPEEGIFVAILQFLLEPGQSGVSGRGSGDPLRLGRLNWGLDPFFNGILNLKRESLYMACSMRYIHFDGIYLKETQLGPDSVVMVYIPSGHQSLGDSKSEIRITKFLL